MGLSFMQQWCHQGICIICLGTSPNQMALIFVISIFDHRVGEPLLYFPFYIIMLILVVLGTKFVNLEIVIEKEKSNLFDKIINILAAY